jgi:hypothetical protein
MYKIFGAMEAFDNQDLELTYNFLSTLIYQSNVKHKYRNRNNSERPLP